MIRSFGVRILPCEKSAIAQTVDEAFRMLEAEGRKPYYIYGNRLGEGNEHTAVSAYADVGEELLAQEVELGEAFTHVYTACGTGSTLAGLAIGLQEGGSRAETTGISISSRNAQRAEECVRKAVCAWYEKQGRDIPEQLWQKLRTETRYNCGGYGKDDKRVRDLIRFVFRNSTIPLDVTYTGKAMRGHGDPLKKRTA